MEDPDNAPLHEGLHGLLKVSKGAKIRNQYNQVPHLTQDTNWKVTNSQLDTTNESQEVSPFQAGDHKAHINRRAQIRQNQSSEKEIQCYLKIITCNPSIYTMEHSVKRVNIHKLSTSHWLPKVYSFPVSFLFICLIWFFTSHQQSFS